MNRRSLAILLTVVIAFHAFLGGVGSAAVFCLGHGHEHASVELDRCELACSHDSSWPLPVPADDHDCDCTDIELVISELMTLLRGDDGSQVVPVAATTPMWGTVVVESGLGRRGPPMPLPWFDPGGVQRCAIVASVRLII